MVLQGQGSGFLRRPAVPAAGSPAPGHLVGVGSGGMLTAVRRQVWPGPPGVCARVLVGPLSPLAPLARPPGCDHRARLLSGHILSGLITPHGSSLRIRHLPKVDV